MRVEEISIGHSPIGSVLPSGLIISVEGHNGNFTVTGRREEKETCSMKVQDGVIIDLTASESEDAIADLIRAACGMADRGMITLVIADDSLDEKFSSLFHQMGFSKGTFGLARIPGSVLPYVK